MENEGRRNKYSKIASLSEAAVGNSELIINIDFDEVDNKLVEIFF